MMTFYARDKEAGNVIDEFATREEAEQAIIEYEEQDKKDGIYEPNFYEVYEEPTPTDYKNKKDALTKKINSWRGEMSPECWEAWNNTDFGSDKDFCDFFANVETVADLEKLLLNI